jgi:hypothetical protein
MQLTLDAMAYDLHLTIRNGRIVDDDDLDIRQIKFWIRNSRAVWIKNELSKGYSISQRFIQDINCALIEKSDIGLCVPIGCTILRTTVEIPNTIEHKGVPTITRIGPAIVNEGTFTMIPYKRVPYMGNGRFNSNAIYAFWKDNRIYLVSDSKSLNFTGMRKVNIRGIFADPENVPGYDATKDYPISEALWVYLKDIVLKSDVTMFLSTIGDVVNDASDTTQPQETGEKELLSNIG